MSTRVRLALLATLVPALPARAQHANPAFARVDSAMVEELRRTSTPGAAIALVVGDSVVHARGFGSTGADGATPVTTTSSFRIASVTKVFTAATLLALADSGRLDLRAPVGTWLGELPDSLRRLTAHQLLSHTGGLVMAPLPGGTGDPLGALAEVARRVPARAAFAPPGDVFSYSNLGYQLAGRLVEVAGGRPYAEQVQRTLLAPLGMTATTFDSAGGPATWPFAGLRSSVLDLSRFAIAFMNAGRIGGRQVISPATIARLAAPVARFQSGEGDYGYGLRLYRHRGVDVVEHGGVAGGYRSLLFMVPSRRVAVIVLANRAGRRPYGVADVALDALLPGVLAPAPATGAPVAMDSAEMARYVGRYANGGTLDVTVDDGVLTLHQGDAAMAIRKLADDRFVALGDEGGQWLTFVRAPDGTVRYLHLNMRAFRRL